MSKAKLKITLFFMASFLFGNYSYAQKLIIKSAEANYDDQKRTCISVQVEPSPKKVKKKVEDWFDDEKDVNLKGFGFLTNKDVLYAKKVNIPEVSPNKMDLYIKVVESDKGSHICVFGSFGYSIHITPESYPKEYKALQNMTLDFLSDYLPDYYKNRIEETEEVIGDLADERKSMSEQLADNKDEIKDLQSENEKLTAEIKRKKVELETADKMLKEREDRLKSVNKKLGEGDKNN